MCDKNVSTMKGKNACKMWHKCICPMWIDLRVRARRLEDKLEVKKLKSERGRSTHKESDKWYFTVLHYCYYSYKSEQLL